MKKVMALLCSLLLICLAVSVSAEAPVSNLYKPNMSETFKALVGGKSFEAGITNISSTGEDEDAKYTITMTVYERDQFDPAVIENLKKQQERLKTEKVLAFARKYNMMTPMQGQICMVDPHDLMPREQSPYMYAKRQSQGAAVNVATVQKNP